MKRYIWWLAVIIFTVPAFVSLLRPGVHNIQDSMQYFRIYEMQKCFDDKQVPCRWVPDMGYGYGYPLYIYYSPGPYFIGTVLHSFGFQYIDCVKVLFVLGFLFSAVGMFKLINTLFSNQKIAFISSLIYVYAPVRAVQVYVRGSLGEFLSLAIFPFLFLFSYRIIKNIGKYNILWFGLSVLALLTTHNLMSLAFFPVLGIWILNLLIQEKKYKKIFNIIIGFLIGFGLSAFYVIPMIFERGFVHLESMTGGYFDFRQHFVNIYQLFVSNHWGYGSSYLGANDDLSLSIGHLQWILGLLAVVLALVNFKKNKKTSITIFLLSIVSLFFIFLTHEKSSFIWNSFGFMSMFQFPWRLLIVTTFTLSLLSGYAINFFKNKAQISVVVIAVPVLLFCLYGGFFKPQKWMNYTDKDMLSGSEFLKQQTASIFDYLPKSATLSPNYKAPDKPEIFDGDAVVLDYKKGSNFQNGKILVNSGSVSVRLPIFDFPGMKVTDNNVVVKFDHNDCRNQDYCFGQISFNLPKGEHEIAVKLNSTVPRKIGDITSLLTILFIPIIFVVKRKWFYEN